jgi:hypothetical protein
MPAAQSSEKWTNYFDPHDPVADPLAHWVGWTEDSIGPDKPFDHFESLPADDANAVVHDPEDVQVDNLKQSSGGGLQAHNYWDNELKFIVPLSKVLA